MSIREDVRRRTLDLGEDAQAVPITVRQLEVSQPGRLPYTYICYGVERLVKLLSVKCGKVFSLALEKKTTEVSTVLPHHEHRLSW